jgi:hypothetical protein
MGRPKSENACEPKYDDISCYLLKGEYPESLRGRRGDKSNFKKMCQSYEMCDGVLYYKHHKHRGDKQGQLNKHCINVFTL